MAVALFHGSMLRSRAAATSAPAKFGNPAVRRKWKARYALSTSLSQTHCRAALLSAKSRAMTKSAAARPSDSQGRNLLHEKPRESLASQTLHPSIEKPMLDGQAEPPPASKLRCGGGERATLGSGGARKYGCDQTRCGGLSVVERPASVIGALNSPHDKRQSLKTKPISRGTERRYGAGGEGVATSSLHVTDGVPRCPSRTT
jgi:hypothetical protein